MTRNKALKLVIMMSEVQTGVKPIEQQNLSKEDAIWLAKYLSYTLGAQEYKKELTELYDLAGIKLVHSKPSKYSNLYRCV